MGSLLLEACSGSVWSKNPQNSANMMSLVSGCCEWYFHKPELHFLMLGLDGAGKTSILERIKHDLGNDDPGESRRSTAASQIPQLSKILPTVGLNIGRLEVRGVNTIIWDLGGQAGLRSIWDKYYPDTHGLIWVVDCSDPSRYFKNYSCINSTELYSRSDDGI
jgi:ADP-ribosylation factor related protein 1